MNYKWEWSYLGEVISYMSKGIVPSYATETSANTIIVLNQKCNRNFQINLDFVRENDLDKKAVPQDRVLKEGDILINSTGTGTAGRIAQLTKAPVPMTVDGHMIIVRSNHCVNPYYLGYALKEKQAQIESLAEGSTGQTEINRTRLCSEIVVRYPSDIYIQEKIVGFLRTLDDKIELNQKINENLERQAEAIFKAWFADFVPFEGIQPKEWKFVALDSLTSLISRGITPKYDDTSDQIVLNQKCIRNHLADLSLARKHKPKVINEKWLQFGDLLLNSTGEGTLGRTAQVWFSPKNMTVDSHITIVRPKDESLIYYIGLWGLSHEREIESLHTGSTGQTELPRDRVKSLLLLLPDIETLAKFNSIVVPMTATIIHNQNESLKLAKIRDTILPKLMSGEIEMLQSSISTNLRRL